MAVLPLVIALVVALSRWYRGVHYVSDVVARFVLGAAWLGLATAIVARAERAERPEWADGTGPGYSR